MHPCSLLAPAKINLDLEIIGDRPDGFHQLVMILQTVSLCDRIELRPQKRSEIHIHCSHPQVPLDQSNLAYRAVQLLKERFSKRLPAMKGVEIIIEKNIPVAAGLAGGSTDGAAVLVGLNEMWQLGLTQPELQTLASELGSDLPFCIAGGTAIATGRGEALDPILDLDHLFVVLAKYENIGVSTPWAYQTYRQQYEREYLKDEDAFQQRKAQTYASPLVKGITEKNGTLIGQSLYNDLEKVVLPAHPPVAHLKETMRQAGGLGTLMSGSGPTVFTLCETQAEAETLKRKVQGKITDPNLSLWVTQLSNHGIQIL